LDHVLIFGARHLRQILTSYCSYYNQSRTHLSLDKDAPLQRTVQRCGTIIATPFCPAYIINTRGYDFREGQVEKVKEQTPAPLRCPRCGAKMKLAKITSKPDERPKLTESCPDCK